jgi:nitrogenase molybdenum-iron protein alpha/beta subunit
VACKIGIRINIPFLQGAYLAFNAIPDVFFMGDGPSCIFDKGEHIHGRHDLFSTLLSCDSAHRIQHTGLNVFNIAGNCEAEMTGAIRRMAAHPGCGAVFLGSMPMCAIVGTDYERVLREALGESRKPRFVMPRRSAVSGDWLDGYAAVLEALASGMDLEDAAPVDGAVALVGYMMDRNEGDHHGNLKELERMLRAVGLEASSIWLSGRPYENLRAARSASAVVSLPHGRKAARILAKRLGAKLIEAELPFGLEASRRFMETLGREFGKEKEARAFVDRELGDVVPRLQWTVPHAFLNRRFAFSGDPHFAAAFAEQIEDLGGRVMGTLSVGGAHHLSADARRALERRCETVFEPVPQDVNERWGGFAEGGVDLIVGSAFAFEHFDTGRNFLEFGYPSESTHFLRDEPFLGFQGALAFLARAANEVARGLGPARADAPREAAPQDAAP